MKKVFYRIANNSLKIKANSPQPKTHFVPTGC